MTTGDNPEQFEPGPTDDELQDFLEKIERQQALSQYFNDVRDRFRSFLEANGVNFPKPEIVEVQTFEEAKNEANSNLALLSIVTTKCMVDALADDLTYDKKTYMKKETQSYLLGLGYSGPWIRLVEQEFEGDSLSAEEEFDAVAEFLEERNKLEAEYGTMTKNLQDEMRQFYIEQSGESISPLIEGMIRLLASTRLLGDKKPTDFIDRARNYIDREGLTSPIWYALIDKFFNQE